MSHENDESITQFCHALGLPEPSINESGELGFQVNDLMTVYLTRMDAENVEFNMIILNIDLKDPIVLRAMLEANCLDMATGAGRLSIFAEDEQVLFCKRWTNEQLEDDKAGDRFEEFIKTGTFWMTDGADMLRKFAKAHQDDKKDQSDMMVWKA